MKLIFSIQREYNFQWTQALKLLSVAKTRSKILTYLSFENGHCKTRVFIFIFRIGKTHHRHFG